MTLQVFPIPNFTNTSVDLLLCDPTDNKPGSQGIVHYAYTVGAGKDAVTRRALPWMQTRDFAGEYRRKHPEVVERLTAGRGYWPGEGVLDRPQGPTAEAEHDAIIRLGALELLGNISSGRLAPTDKDPFPHQLALQQHVRELTARDGTRRILIADEVGLGKTIEVALILRDMLLARGRVDDFRCLYLTSGGLVDDAVAKLRDVLSGSIEGRQIVATVSSFRNYGKEDTTGVHVASTHAARLYVGESEKKKLQPGNRPQVVIIDECHHAASEGELAGTTLKRSDATQTYVAVKQLLSGEFWPDSEPPELAILMSATPFRSRAQFVNLLRLLTDGVMRPDKSRFRAFDAGVKAEHLRSVLQDENASATVAWRRQSDEGVRSWSGKRIFPNLTIVRPHLAAEEDTATPRLPAPSPQFLSLIKQVKDTVARIARAHGQSFGGFATAQLEKKLTSSSIAGACTLFTWAVRHCEWATQDEYKKDARPGTEGLRRLLRLISQRIAEGNPQTTAKHATVGFPSDGFAFQANDIAQRGLLTDIQRYSKHLRDDDEVGQWVADDAEIGELVGLSETLLGVAPGGERVEGAQDAKLAWLREMLRRYPDHRFILFTESLQTCETLKNALGSACAVLEGSMSKPKRLDAVEALRDPEGTVRVLVATSAADEGIDLQVASKVIHWDLSSSPATLMQRNGRAARLGQIQDVVAYYLILRGTHEDNRDSSLQRKFAELGIDDEAMKSRILGSLSEEEEQQLDEAIEENNDRVAGDILKKAAKDNEEMDHELADIRADFNKVEVLSRDDLDKRLANWWKIGLPESATGITFRFDKVLWKRPVFDTVSRAESATATIARVESEGEKQTLVFDPEFLLFGPKLAGERPRLAGLPPWINKPDRHKKHQIVPSRMSDLLGKLFQAMARLKSADFLSLPAAVIGDDLLPGNGARWLLFCTHPLREAENTLPPKVRPYLTYYAFGEVSEGTPAEPINPEGADANDVHKVLERAEAHAIARNCADSQDPARIKAAKQAGQHIQAWVRSATRFGAASFLEEAKYFVPIPVCLISIVR
jgi:superfamily II DNA or RNA helicase